jgi:hypothetical protein
MALPVAGIPEQMVRLWRDYLVPVGAETAFCAGKRISISKPLPSRHLSSAAQRCFHQKGSRGLQKRSRRSTKGSRRERGATPLLFVFCPVGFFFTALEECCSEFAPSAMGISNYAA